MAANRSKQDNSEQSPPEGAPLPLPVVGIGASAGGIEALQHLLPAIEADSGLAYVVVQHLDPERDSALVNILRPASPLPMSWIKDGMTAEANHIYVAPPNATLAIEGDKLRAKEPNEPRGQRTPIDSFLTSLARERGDRAACIILSGTGSDGTIGLRAIKENEGLTMAQAGAEYDGMMRSALSTGLVDYVLPVDQIPQRLADYFRHVNGKAADVAGSDAADYLTQICALLRVRTGHDFSGYKDETIARRVQRRMQVLQVDSVPEFLERLRKDPREVDLLFQDLLIGVTHFFRDPAAFETLEREVIPRLFDGKTADDTVRVWVAGCSTGEEAYSIAILLRDHAQTLPMPPKLQIFASDIDGHALQVARLGRYPAAIARDVPEKRLERYFQREDGSYRAVDDIRKLCLFSLHNLLRDAPFSKLDLLCCRNLLIYLNSDLQSRAVPLFHYALSNNGYLFLGASENVTRHSRLFATVDKAHRLFQKRSQPDRKLPEFPLSGLASPVRVPGPAMLPPNRDPSLQASTDRLILERYAPAYVVINADGEVLHASARTGKYLELPAGAPRLDIFSMARPGLRADLRAAVHKAIVERQTVAHDNITIGTDGGRQTIGLVVQPVDLPGMQEHIFMVVFQDVGAVESGPEPGSAPAADVESANIRQLETELRATRERLQTTTEELESSNEELRAGNEELSSMNEELQSANEELETSKEELQSINEELQTVNTELNSRIEELGHANSDIANLLESTQIATVFLDRNLAVKSFTPAAKDIFRLVESDTGRPITHVRTRLTIDTVQEDAERVLRTLAPIEREVQSSHSSARYIMRMLPYRTVEDVIAGVVITFVDVTKISAAEAKINMLTLDLRDRIQKLETLLDFVPVGILIMQGGDTPPEVNRHASLLLGLGAHGAVPREMPSLRLFQNGRELPAAEQPLQRAAQTGKPVSDFEGALLRADGSRLDVTISATPLLSEDRNVRGAIATIVDVSERKTAERRQDLLLRELQHRVKNILASIAALANRMLKSSPPNEEFASAFLGRLQAMGAMHELLWQRGWEGADLRALITAVLAPYATVSKGNLILDGPDIRLSAHTATDLGMALYELATNAAKYGALSSVDGRVEVAWRTVGNSGDASLSLTWTERGGPPVAGPAKEGFGTAFLKRSIEYSLGGQTELDLSPEGLRCSIAFPLRDHAQVSGTVPGAKSDGPGS